MNINISYDPEYNSDNKIVAVNLNVETIFEEKLPCVEITEYTVSTGGNLKSGAYEYAITGVNEYGETEPSKILIHNPLHNNIKIIIKWSPLNNVSKYRVYRENKFVEVLSTEFIDDGTLFWSESTQPKSEAKAVYKKEYNTSIQFQEPLGNFPLSEISKWLFENISSIMSDLKLLTGKEDLGPIKIKITKEVE